MFILSLVYLIIIVELLKYIHTQIHLYMDTCFL